MGGASARKRAPVREEDLEGFRYLKHVRRLLRHLHEHCHCPNRKLHYDDYATLLLFYFFNSILTSLRGLQAATGFDKVRRKLGIGRASLGSLSEASQVFDPELLREVFEGLAEGAVASDAVERPRGLPDDLGVLASDGSILEALPRMVWALWLRKEHNGVRIHLDFDKWLKCVLGCKHLVAESENGLRIQVYAALIASLLIVLWTGRKPTKRTYELLQFYLSGWVSEEELDEHLAKLKRA